MGFGCEYKLLLQRTAKSSSQNYSGNLGRTCRRSIVLGIANRLSFSDQIPYVGSRAGGRAGGRAGSELD